jgi:selenium metabolism protein YedF
MKIVDARGELCPKPLIMAKQAISQLEPGEQIEILSDNETSYNNLMTFLKALGTNPQSSKENDVYRIIATSGGQANTPALNPEAYCETSTPAQKGNFVVAIKSNKMGEGDDQLGKMLIRGFINALPELTNLPSHIIFYNSGVFLATKGTDTAETLKKLEQAGVNIVVCGTCVDFFNLKDQMETGTISNMYHIATLLASTGHVIYP